MSAEDIREALLVADTFFDGTDYHFDRLSPDEQQTIVEAARAYWGILENGERAEK